MKKYYWTILLLFISGCGPQYSTTYSYVRPTTEHGQSCIFQCENSRLQCSQNEDLKLENCESREREERLSYDLCVEKNGQKKCSSPSMRFCYRNNSICKESYNQCYSSCGGTVTSNTVCVSNCDKIKK